jgi:hypothetical protein
MHWLPLVGSLLGSGGIVWKVRNHATRTSRTRQAMAEYRRIAEAEGEEAAEIWLETVGFDFIRGRRELAPGGEAAAAPPDRPRG